MIISDLTEFQDREVVLQLKDGEILHAKITFVDSEYQDIIVDVVDVLSTDRPDRYKDRIAQYTVAASEIVAVTLSV